MTRRWSAWLFALVALGALAAAACYDTVDEPDNPYAISGPLPFAAGEAYAYVLVDDNGKQVGTNVLAVYGDGDSLTLVQSSSDEDGNADESVLVVDAATLLPRRGHRDIIDADDDRRALVESEYAVLNDKGDYGVRIRQSRFDPIEDDSPDVRCSPLKAPRSAFDNDSSLFLWRTLPFEEGRIVEYTDVLTNRRDKEILTVRVRRKEEVETRAGTFEAWLVGITGESGTQDACFATSPDHRLLRYDNDSVVFLFNGETAPPSRPEAPGGVPPECR
jgi:hypothetical protein